MFIFSPHSEMEIHLIEGDNEQALYNISVEDATRISGNKLFVLNSILQYFSGR